MDAVRPLASLNQPIETSNGSETHLADTIHDTSGETEWLEQMALSQAFEELDERERYILRARIVEGRTQMEVAKRLNVSQVQISRLERKALDRLKFSLADVPISHDNH
jgi:RNA polymerase sporulation-specific sigma factor